MPRPFSTLAAIVVSLAVVSPEGAAAARSHHRSAARRAHAIAHAAPAATELASASAGPPVRAGSAILVDMASGRVLFERNADEVRPIASITKLMVALVVLDRGLDLTAVTKILPEDKETARGGARSRLLLGRSFRNQDLLTAMLMQSDNRAVTALGRAVGLTPAGLVDAMNGRAVELGLAATAFTDPVGLSPGNVSTPREIADLLTAALALPAVHDITTRPAAEIVAADGSGYRATLVNTDHVAREQSAAPWTLLGGKTGYTDKAHYCLAIAATVAGENVAMVFLGEQGKLTRFADFERAARWLASRATGSPASALARP